MNLNGKTASPWETQSRSQNRPLHRMIALLERVGTRDSPVTLQELTEETGQPKATVHRMLQQLEEAELVTRKFDGRHYTTGSRLRSLCERTLLNDIEFAARHRVLADLVARVGESCNLTALSGSEVIYLDRVETSEPLRFTLQVGTRVPAHASASGKILLSQVASARRKKMLGSVPLVAFTPKTITSVVRLEEVIETAAMEGYALDDEEFLPGLVCVAAIVPNPHGVSNLAVAVQGPALRMPPEKIPNLIEELDRTARLLARVEYEADSAEQFPGVD